MKLKIEKTDREYITIEFARDSTVKPSQLRLKNEEAETLLSMLDVATKADRFTFVLET